MERPRDKSCLRSDSHSTASIHIHLHASPLSWLLIITSRNGSECLSDGSQINSHWYNLWTESVNHTAAGSDSGNTCSGTLLLLFIYILISEVLHFNC